MSITRRTSARSTARSQLATSLRVAERVDAGLRLHSLLPFEPESANNGVHCFFYAALDAMQRTGSHQDMLKLRREVKAVLRDRYAEFDRSGLIDAWQSDHPADKDDRRTKQFRWNQFINEYALVTIRPRAGDEYTCHALAELAQCEVHVHTGDQPIIYRPLNGAASRDPVHLAYYCAEGRCHYRSTRPLGGNAENAALRTDNGAAAAASQPARAPRSAASHRSRTVSYGDDIHAGPKHVLQLRLQSLQDMHTQGRMDAAQMSSRQDDLRHHFGTLPNDPAETIMDTDPYRFLGRFVRHSFIRPDGEPLGEFNGVVTWFNKSTNDSYVVFEDGDAVRFAQADMHIVLNRYNEFQRAAVPPSGQRIQDPDHVLFGALCAHPGSFEDSVQQGGGLRFVANKFRAGSLFDIRDFNMVPPMPTPHANLAIQECMKGILLLCDKFPEYSDERYILRNVAHIFLPLLYVYGNHRPNIEKAHKEFNAGKWEKLWNRAQSNAATRRARLEANPRNNAPRSDEQKIKYATTLAQKGNLTKANSIITKELIPAIDDTTVVKLARKHPARPLDFNTQYWPEDEETLGYWGTLEGRAVLREKFSTTKIRKFFQSRKPCSSPDKDGWRGREHLLPLLMNSDKELHALFRSELILPHVFGDFHPQDLNERFGGELIAFLKADMIDIRPLNCSAATRRCAASLICTHLKRPAHHFLTTSILNFKQCAGGLSDGASRAATLIQLLYEREQDANAQWPRAVVQVDTTNAFNALRRKTLADCASGIASFECDNGNIPPGTAILAFPAMKPFFPYVKSVISASSINRFVDHKGETHIIHGTTGLQQGDPLSMLLFSVAVQPIWSRVMGRSPTTHGVGIADDAFLEDDLPQVLHTLADAIKSFRSDADLEMQPTKLKIHVKGVSLERARELIETCIDNDASLESIRVLLDSDCIQVDGLRVAGVPVGSPEFIANYVRSKALDIVQDIAKLNMMEADPLVHYHLVKNCQHTRLAFLARNLPPAQMTRPANGIVGPQHVDRAVSQAILRVGTADNVTTWPPDVQQWCERVIQLPYHLGGFGITPLVHSGKAGYYSATAKFISWLATLPNADFWLPSQHDLTQPDTWVCPRLATFMELHHQFRTEFKFPEWVPPANASDAVPAQVPPTDIAPTLPPLNLLATLQVQPGEDEDNAPKGPELPSQRRITAWIMQQVLSDAPPPTQRMGQMVQLHQAQSIPTVGPLRVDDPRDYSILRTDMPHRDNAAADAPGKQHCLTYSILGFLSPHYLSWTAQSGGPVGPSLTLREWQSWFCQCLGIAPPAMAAYAQQLCPCRRQHLDTDHLHTCPIYAGTWLRAHEGLLSAVADIAHAAGYQTNRGKRVPTSRGQKRGDLELKGLNVAGMHDLIIDVAIVHDFHGKVADPARHGQLRHANPDKVLIDMAVSKSQGNEYRPDYLRNHNKAFLPLIMSTSGRLHSEFVRLLYILAHRRAVRFFAALDYEPCHEELCQRRGAFFFQHRARIGLAGAQAAALRMGSHTQPSMGARPQPPRSLYPPPLQLLLPDFDFAPSSPLHGA